MKSIYPSPYVPPSGPDGTDILLVGEAPGEQEQKEGKPFVGQAGQVLLTSLSRSGIDHTKIKLFNLFGYRPYHNRFEYILNPQNKEVFANELAKLYSYIATHKPKVIGALGKWPLYFLTHKEGISHWRGSILPYAQDPTIKVIPTYHPSAVSRDNSLYPIFDTDIKRIVQDSQFREFRLPNRKFILDPTGLELEEWIIKLSSAPHLAVDIEAVKNSADIICVGFAPSPDIGVSIRTDTPEKCRAIARILESSPEKIFHNGIYDTLVLELNGYTTVNYTWDTMIAQHVMEPELPKALDYLTSIYTREPYYKTEGRRNIPSDQKAWGKKTNMEALLVYNCKDVCVTFEIAQQQRIEIKQYKLERLYQFEMESQDVAYHISMSGMLIDNDRRQELIDIVTKKLVKKQEVMFTLAGADFNPGSSQQVQVILYDKKYLGLPTRRTRDGKITTEEDAIVSLITYCKGQMDKVIKESTKLQWKRKWYVCKLILEIRGFRKLISTYLNKQPSADGRLRSLYKVTGTETGRWSASKFVDGSGFNAQTFPRDPISDD